MAVASRRFDVIVSDLAMPGTDGYAFMQQVRANGTPGATTPAIALTAHAGVGTGVRARASGFEAIVTKPCDIDTLVRVIQRVLPHP